MDYRHNISKEIGATFKLSGFYNHIQNQIQLALEDPRTNLYRYINIGLMNSRGITVQSDLFINQLNVQISGSIMDNESRYDFMSGIASWQLMQATLNVRYDFPKYESSIQLFSRFTGPTIGYTNTAELYRNSSYYLTDISATKKFWNNRILLQAGCKNLFNVRQINTSLQSGGVHGSGTSGINIGTGRNIFAQCIITL
jgi:outer membrane receptor for ferrienterochelin and colicins